MWAANKLSIVILIVGLCVIFAIRYFLMRENPELAEQFLSLAICALLLGCAMTSFLLARGDLKRSQAAMDEDDSENESGEEHSENKEN